MLSGARDMAIGLVVRGDPWPLPARQKKKKNSARPLPF